MEYEIDKLEDLGLRNLAKLVLEKEERIVELQEIINKAIEKLKVIQLKNIYEDKEITKLLEILKGE